MDRPTLKPINNNREKSNQITYFIEGNLIPTLLLEITPKQSVFFEHHLMSWKEPSLNMATSKHNRQFKRAIGGMQIILLEASGTGKISLSRHGAGHIFPIQLAPGQTLDVREHQYVAATSNLDYKVEHISEIPNVMYGGTAFFIDQFKATNTEGMLWLHSYGDLFEITLGNDEQIDIDSGSWVYKDTTVGVENQKDCFSIGALGTRNVVYKRFTGPGRVGIQTVSLTMAFDSSVITRGKKGLIGFLFGLLARTQAK